MLDQYAPILVLLGLVLGFALISLALSSLLGGRHQNREKASAYECGMDVQGPARIRLSIHFYLVAVLFIVFDVEAIFLILWAKEARAFSELGVGLIVFLEIAFFVGVLGLTLVYEWRKGGLEWDR